MLEKDQTNNISEQENEEEEEINEEDTGGDLNINVGEDVDMGEIIG